MAPLLMYVVLRVQVRTAYQGTPRLLCFLCLLSHLPSAQNGSIPSLP